MQLSTEQIAAYESQGFLVLPHLLQTTEVELLTRAFEKDCGVSGEHRIAEEGSDEIRAVYASHVRQPEFADLIRLPRILGPVRQILAGEAYIYQFKINSKAPFSGAGWAWHRDYEAWRLSDNLPAPRLVNVGIFFDDIDEFNGPVIFCPGSHRDSLPVVRPPLGPASSEQHVDPKDIALTQADMTYLVDRHGLVSAKGGAGTVVLFDPELVHGSASNVGPFRRRLLIVTYNDVTNEPRPLGEPRPEYVVGRDTRPLVMTGHELLPLVKSGAMA